MYPVLFEFGPLKVYTWGLMVGIGILMGLWVVLWKAREAGIDTDKVVNLPNDATLETQSRRSLKTGVC